MKCRGLILLFTIVPKDLPCCECRFVGNTVLILMIICTQNAAQGAFILRRTTENKRKEQTFETTAETSPQFLIQNYRR